MLTSSILIQAFGYLQDFIEDIIWRCLMIDKYITAMSHRCICRFAESMTVSYNFYSFVGFSTRFLYFYWEFSTHISWFLSQYGYKVIFWQNDHRVWSKKDPSWVSNKINVAS